MSYGIKGSALGGAEQMQMSTAGAQNTAKQAYNAACNAAPSHAPSQDPASLREQLAALYAMCEHINSQRNRLRELADFVLGPEPEEATAGACSTTPPGSGVVSDMVSAFTRAGVLLWDVDRQIDRLQRVAS